MISYNDSVINKFDDPESGNAASGATVTVRDATTGAKASIYSDDGVTPISNPLTTDDYGNYTFFAASGIYDLVINEGLPSQRVVSDVSIFETDTLSYDNVSDMVATSVPVGTRAKCARYYSGGDLVAGLEYYCLTPAQYGGTPDGYVDHYDAAGNVLKLVRQQKEVDALTAGASKSFADNAEYIQAAIDYLNSGSGGVVIVQCELSSSTIFMKSYVTVMGVSNEEGWAREGSPADYDYRSVLKLSDNTNAELISIPSGTKQWGIENIMLDANGANQSTYDSFAIRSYTTSGTRNFGGVISGVRCVNPKGYSAFLSGGPLNINNTFFMSGAVLESCSDLKISNVDFDGTGGLHPSLTMSKCNSAEAISNIFAFGWGEVDNSLTLQTESGTVTASSQITLTPTWLYEGAPVTCATLQPSSKPFAVYFAHEASAGVWELYERPYGYGSTDVKATFGSTGAITLRHGGNEAVAYLSNCVRVGVTGARFGGGNGQGLVLANCDRTCYVNVHTFNNNLRSIGSPSVSVIDSTRNTFSACQFGELTGGVEYAVAFEQSGDDLCYLNILEESCILHNTATAIQVYDNTHQDYELRNKWVCKNVTLGTGYTFGGASSGNKNKEPGILSAEIDVNTTALTASANTPITMSVHKFIGVTVSSSNISIPVTDNGMYRLCFRFTLDAVPTTDVLYKVNGLSAVLPQATVRHYSGSRSCEFNIEFVSTVEQAISLSLEAFTTDSGLSIVTGSEYSWITVSKIGDVVAS